ncbi:MAG TPA: hypothetical protein DCY53_01440, partial [Desulfobacteraceae bacterium]|nr:hypothetical protein [Desulfobacteraceae bacterium]
LIFNETLLIQRKELSITEKLIHCRYLTIKTTQGCSIPITYILFPTKMQKGKPTKIDLPL